MMWMLILAVICLLVMVTFMIDVQCMSGNVQYKLHAPMSLLGRGSDISILFCDVRVAAYEAYVDIQPRILLPGCKGVDVLTVGLLGSHVCVPERTSSGAKLSS